MNNKEYMEYEGYRIIEAALLSYTSPAGSLLSAAPGNHGLVWDYILFRLYLAEKTIRRFPSGFMNFMSWKKPAAVLWKKWWLPWLPFPDARPMGN